MYTVLDILMKSSWNPNISSRMNCLNFGTLILASLYNMGWVGESGWLCCWFMTSTSLNTWGRLIKNVFSIRAYPTRWKRYWNQIKSSHNDAKGWIILVTELDYTCNWTQILPKCCDFPFPSGFENTLKRIFPIWEEFMFVCRSIYIRRFDHFGWLAFWSIAH